LKTKLHIGAGPRDFGNEWTQIDGQEYPHSTCIRDLDHLPYEDNTFSLIYSSHTLEYFDSEEVIKVLTEWKRVLKPGGILRLSVPNFKTLAELYLNEKVSLDRLTGPLFGMMKMGDNKIFHKTVYDFESLYRLLIKTGFKNPYLWDIYDTEHRMFDDHSMAKIPTSDYESRLISLNLQATK